jgi:hypothetical protein
MTRVHVKRTFAIVLGAGAVAAWLQGAATSRRPLPDPIIPHAATIDVRGEELAKEIAKLHERLRPTATPHTPGRNLFAFRTAPAIVAAVPIPRAALTEAPIAPAVAQPALKLSGIAEDPGDDGPIRQAVISGGGQLFIVKEGELVTPRYRVVKISSDVVELTDLVDGSTRRLALR